MKLRLIGLLLGMLCCVACLKKKAPLGPEKFTALLIDMHMADGTLSQAQGYRTDSDKSSYAYYNALFRKYGIDRAEFDSCMYFYSARPEMFDPIYERVIDSINRRLTEQNRLLADLKANDSVNYFPYPDTLLLDAGHPAWVVEIDSIVPGFYRFSTTVRFDTVRKDRKNWIRSFFISGDGKDTLQVREIRLSQDTVARHYEWAQYVDSLYDRLVIRLADSDRPGKSVPPKGRIWNTTLFRPYTPERTLERLKKSLSTKKETLRLQRETVLLPGTVPLLRHEPSGKLTETVE